MPLHTSITRDGELLQLRWGNFHVAAMALAASFDAGTGPLSDPAGIYEQELPGLACYPDAAFPVTREIAYLLTDYGALGKTPLNNGRYVLTRRHAFLDPRDGEVLRLEPGDVLEAWRA